MEVVKTKSVENFLDGLSADLESRVLRMLQSLEKNGYSLRMPDSKPLGKGLFELRILSNPHIRILYFFDKNTAILVNAFVKKSMKIQRKEIEYGRKIMKVLKRDL